MWQSLRGFLESYDAAVMTLGSFVPPDMPLDRVEIIPPAIDPISPKNMDVDGHLARRVLDWIGVEAGLPLMTQVSRFDPWKDPLGVVDVYRLVRKEVPNLQLALAASMALDDPEGWEIYEQIQDAVGDDPDIHVFTNLTGVSNVEVNAFQRLSEVVVQKSIREGFGLVVSETLWKGTPVVAGRAGGIPLQLQDGVGGFLVDSVEECAERVCELLGDADLRTDLGRRGREHVRERFLLTRLIADELRLCASVVGTSVPSTDARGLSGLGREERDPVCGMRVDETSPTVEHGRRTYRFCSWSCRDRFVADPGAFLRVPQP